MQINRKKQFGIVDFHAHILPTADHGSDSVETTLFQLKSAIEHGIDRIIATPHFYPNGHTVESFLNRRSAAYKLLLPHLTSDLPEIRLGAEVLICEGIEHLPDLEKLFVYGTSSLLLELPFSSFREEYCDSVGELVARGVDVIIAHADRYPEENIERVIEAGARIQLNASSLSLVFSRKCIYDWLSRDLVVALGSDIHNKDKRAYPDFVRACSRIGSHADFIKEQSDIIWSLSKKPQI